MAEIDHSEHYNRLKRIEERVFNGITTEMRKEVKEELKELRKEMADGISAVRNLVVGILVSMLLGLVVMIVDGRANADIRSKENAANYSAIIENRTAIQYIKDECNATKALVRKYHPEGK